MHRVRIVARRDRGVGGCAVRLPGDVVGADVEADARSRAGVSHFGHRRSVAPPECRGEMGGAELPAPAGDFGERDVGVRHERMDIGQAGFADHVADAPAKRLAAVVLQCPHGDELLRPRDAAHRHATGCRQPVLGRALFLAFRRSDDIDDIDYPPPQGAPSAFGLPCTLRRSGNLVHPPPSAFRARVVDVVGIVDVVDRPRPLRAAPKAAPGLRAGSRSLARISRRILWKYFIYNWKYFIYNHDISRVEFGVFPGRSRAGLGPWIRRGSGREGGAKPQRENRGRRAERATPRCARGHESPAPGARPCRMARLVRRTSRLQR